jgi:hypothetical protein
MFALAPANDAATSLITHNNTFFCLPLLDADACAACFYSHNSALFCLPLFFVSSVAIV